MNVDKLVDDLAIKGEFHPILHSRYTSWAGVDCIVTADGERKGRIQSISYTSQKEQGEWVATGTIVQLCLDDGCANFPDNIKVLQVIAANEFGASCLAFELHDVEIIRKSSGISIDDIVIEDQFEYRARAFVPGRKLTSKSWAEASWTTLCKTKHISIVDSPETKALVQEAISQTSEEPQSFVNDLLKLFSKYKVVV